MRRSVFCVCPPGNTQDSARVWRAIILGCIPVTFFRRVLLAPQGTRPAQDTHAACHKPLSYAGDPYWFNSRVIVQMSELFSGAGLC